MSGQKMCALVMEGAEQTGKASGLVRQLVSRGPVESHCDCGCAPLKDLFELGVKARARNHSYLGG